MSSNRVRRWLRRHGMYTGRISKVIYVAERHDLPDLPAANTLAIAGSMERPKWILFDCPCGYGHVVLLPTSPVQGRASWNLDVSTIGPSLHPSIDRTDGVRCHFWLRGGVVHWVDNQRALPLN